MYSALSGSAGLFYNSGNKLTTYQNLLNPLFSYFGSIVSIYVLSVHLSFLYKYPLNLMYFLIEFIFAKVSQISPMSPIGSHENFDFDLMYNYKTA